MGAREELAAIRERSATARVRATEDESDLARRPTRLMSQSQHDRRLLARDNVRLVKALEAVLEELDRLSDEGIAQYKATRRIYYDGYSDGTQVAELRALDAIEAALTTDTKGDADV